MTESLLTTLLQRTRSLGASLDDTVLSESQRLWAQASRRVPADLQCIEDAAYGPHERHRLDVFFSPAAQNTPVLIFVHGGGFTGGDKRRPGSCFHQNIGAWAVEQGMTAVNMTYRLAPDAQWPAVTEDIAHVLRWVAANIGNYGGNPDAVVLMGNSAGAAHVANFIAHINDNAEFQTRVRGAALLSGIYDIVSASKHPSIKTYYGTDPDLYRARSSMQPLARSSVPLFLVVAEYEPAWFHAQALQLAQARLEQQGRMPLFYTAQGHNHFSETYHFGSEDRRLPDAVARFAHQVCY